MQFTAEVFKELSTERGRIKSSEIKYEIKRHTFDQRVKNTSIELTGNFELEQAYKVDIYAKKARDMLSIKSTKKQEIVASRFLDRYQQEPT